MDGWANQGLLATTQFAWSLVLRSCSQWSSLVSAVDVLEDDGAIFDMAVEGGVFGFLRSCVIGANNFHHEVLMLSCIQKLQHIQHTPARIVSKAKLSLKEAKLSIDIFKSELKTFLFAS
jgi:hypothetical protein